jgi:pyruvate dehydrogenase (quinone)
MTGLLGFSSGYKAMESCDALLMLGTDFPYRQFFPGRRRSCRSTSAASSWAGARRSTSGSSAVRETAAALLPLLEADRSDAHAKEPSSTTARRGGLDDLAVDDGKAPVHPQYVAGCSTSWPTRMPCSRPTSEAPSSGRALPHDERQRRLLGSFLHGSMANAMPQALGAQASDRSRQVIALAGDGGLAMLLGDLLSIRQNDLPVKIVVFNNSSLNFVELEMKAAGIVNFGTGLENRASPPSPRRWASPASAWRARSCARPRAGARDRRAGARRRRDRAQGAVDAAVDHGRAGEGLHRGR